MPIANLIRCFYFLVGLAYLAAGIVVLAYRSGALPMEAIYVMNQICRDSPIAFRILQDFATHLIGVGIFALWFAYQYELSWVFQWVMTIAWGIFALMRWLDVRMITSDYRAWINYAIPFFVFLGVGILRWRIERSGW